MSTEKLINSMTSQQQQAFREAIYQISDAQQSLLSIQTRVRAQKKWRLFSELQRITSTIEEELVNDVDGVLTPYLKVL